MQRKKRRLHTSACGMQSYTSEQTSDQSPKSRAFFHSRLFLLVKMIALIQTSLQSQVLSLRSYNLSIPLSLIYAIVSHHSQNEASCKAFHNALIAMAINWHPLSFYRLRPSVAASCEFCYMYLVPHSLFVMHPLPSHAFAVAQKSTLTNPSTPFRGEVTMVSHHWHEQITYLQLTLTFLCRFRCVLSRCTTQVFFRFARNLPELDEC